MVAVPAYTTPGAGGITIPSNAYPGDFSNLLRGLFDGSNDGTGPHPENGLETAIIPRFLDYGDLVAAYPPDTTPVHKSPAFARVFAPGDDFAVMYRLDPVVQKWTPTAGFAGLQDAPSPTDSFSPIGPGEARGLLSLTVPNLGEGQALVTVSAAIRIDFASEDDMVDYVLRVKVGSAALTEVRRVTCAAPKAGHNSAVLPSYSFFVNGGDGFTLQTLYARTAGASGTCGASTESRYTNLQFFAQSL